MNIRGSWANNLANSLERASTWVLSLYYSLLLFVNVLLVINELQFGRKIECSLLFV